MDKAFLDRHYEEIISTNKSIILSGGTGDVYLANALEDNRMAFVILIRISHDITQKIDECISELKTIEPDLYYYPNSDMHITVMNILKGEEGRNLPDNYDKYINCIENCSKDVHPFEIVFDGLTASAEAIMVRGYYDEILLQFREKLRNLFEKNGLLLEERYKTISSHITIARLYDKYRNPKKLMDYIVKPHLFGKMTVSSMEISFHNWYDTRKQIIKTVELTPVFK